MIKKCKNCDFMVNEMFSKKYCYEHLVEFVVQELPVFQPVHIQAVLNLLMEHYHPLKHPPRLDEHVKKEWNGDDISDIEA